MYIKDMKPKTHWVVKVCMLFWTKEKANNEQWSETSKQNEELFMNRKKCIFPGPPRKKWDTDGSLTNRLCQISSCLPYLVCVKQVFLSEFFQADNGKGRSGESLVESEPRAYRILGFMQERFKNEPQSKVEKQVLLGRKDKHEKLLQSISPHKRRERPQPTLEVELISVSSFYGKLLVWGNSGKRVGFNFNFLQGVPGGLFFAFVV